ncbi:hypothetical protein [Streptomyces sp. NPDC046832]|uniref:hypothetical protein n=1 Tax=Streptomyces sp. NPDC046832 TaxID=3155020 RepID=UPI0033E05E55
MPKAERVNNLQEAQLENLLRRVKDDVDPNSKEISKKAAADAIADVSEVMDQKNIDPSAGESWGPRC